MATRSAFLVLLLLYSCGALRIPSELALKSKSCYAVGPDDGPKDFSDRGEANWWTCANLPNLCNGQNCEDRAIYNRFFRGTPSERNGVFLEAGGLDGVKFSNSLLFEQCLDWDGMLIEGSSQNFMQLVKNRPCTKNVHSAICDADHSEVKFSTFEGSDGGVARDLDAVNVSLSKNEYEMVPCRRLSAILQDNGIPHIDFLSLDVEGAEETVLKTLDFKKVSIGVLMLETDRLSDLRKDEEERKIAESRMTRIHQLLTSNGLVKVPSDPRELPHYDFARIGRGIEEEKDVYLFLGIAGSDLYVTPEICKYDACPTMNCEAKVTQHCSA